jgi:hypothetical protein
MLCYETVSYQRVRHSKKKQSLWDQTQLESVRIEDSSSERLPEKTKKRDGLVGSHRLKKEDIPARSVISAEWYNCYKCYNCW